jgi:hypothetical protein
MHARTWPELELAKSRPSEAMPLSHDQAELSQMSALCGSRLQKRLRSHDLRAHQWVSRRKTLFLVSIEVGLQVFIQGLQAHLLRPKPVFIRDAQPEQTPEGVLEAAQISRVHGVNCQVIQESARASEQVRGLNQVSSTRQHVLFVSDQRAAMRGIGSEIPIVEIFLGMLGRLAHPAEGIALE